MNPDELAQLLVYILMDNGDNCSRGCEKCILSNKCTKSIEGMKNYLNSEVIDSENTQNIRFACEKCGCTYEVQRTECSIQMSQKNNYSTRCPICNHINVSD